MLPTQSQIDWAGLLIGTKAPETVETPPRAYLQPREQDLLLLAAGRKALKPLEAGLRALSLTSMSKTNPVSLWLIARPRLSVGVGGLPEAARGVVAIRHTTVAVRDPAAPIEEASNRGVGVNEEAQGGDGEIGKRCLNCVSLLFTTIDLRSPRQGGRARESSVAINPSWSMLEEVEMLRLSKLRMEVDEPEDL